MQRKPMPYGYGSMNSHVKKNKKKVLKRCSNLRQLAALVMHEYFFSLFFLPSHFYFHPTETSFSDGGDAVRESHTHARQFHSPQMIFLPRFLRKKKTSLENFFFPRVEILQQKALLRIIVYTAGISTITTASFAS